MQDTLLTQAQHKTQPTFTSLEALGPCMVKLRVANIPTILEPSPVASTTGAFTRFLGSPALETQTCGSGRWHCTQRRRDARPS